MRIVPIISAYEKLWRRIVIAAAVLVLLACAGRALYKVDDGDFKLHWESGRRFLAGEFLYANGHNMPYPPFWAMAHAPASVLPLPAAKAVLFPIGIVALVVLLWTLRRLAGTAFSLDRTSSFWVAALAILLVGRFAIRDMAELGVNTALVTLTWFGIYFWRQKREWLGGASLGMAIALKCTPVIFLGYFLWKRQWKMVAATGTAAAIFTLAPMVWQGPASYSSHLGTWLGNVWRGVANADPSVGVLGPEPLQNMSLRPALARYLMHLPADHPGRATHQFYIEFLSLPPSLANWIIKIVLLAVLGMFLWWSRRAVVTRDEPRLPWELAAVSILMLLISPITWGQHCVALLPACYFISVLLISRGDLPTWMIGVLTFYIVFVVLLSRDLLGRDLSLLLASYHVETFAILGLLAVTTSCRDLATRTRARAESELPPPPADHPV